jgi:hypothetical protein
VAVAYTSVSAIKTHMGVSDSVDDAAFTAIATAVNDFIEDWIGFPAGSGSTAIRTYDGHGGDRLFIRGGVQGITTLEVANQTGGTYTSLGTAEYVLRPHSYDRPTGWPGWWLQLTETATTNFTYGYDTIRITPATGWDFSATPSELKRIADILGVRMYQARKTGETLVIGSTDFGQVIARFLPEPEYRDYLDHFAYSLGGKRRVG